MEIPANWYLDDLPPMMFIKKAPNSHGFVNPRHLEEMWRDQFDWVYREHEHAVFTMTIHPDVSGRPQVLLMLERLIEHIQSHAGVPTQFDKLLGDNECLVKKLDMIPVECVVRNYAAGSLVKRLGVEEGMKLNPYTFELFLKDDAKGDPFINESHVVAFGWGTAEQLVRMKELSLKVNDVLNKLFDDAGLLLVDFKLEFGVFHDGSIVLGDEFSPDGCRLWDKATGKKMDKDRFRQGLGDVIEAYEEVANRLGVPL